MTTWDEAKRRSNLAKHGVDLADSERFEFDTARIEEDRDVRCEQRFRAIGFLGDRLYFIVFTPGAGDEPHVISMRLATPKEKRSYVQGYSDQD